MRSIVGRFALAFSLAAAAVAAPAAHAQSGTVRIAWIDPLSGLMAPIGQNQLRSFQYVAEIANRENWAGEVDFEIVPFDSKVSPQESLTALKSAIDQGIRYVAQGNGSSVALALSDAVSKHNTRNPGKEVLFLNYAAVDPSLTNDKCSFWHFSFDLNSDMKMEALTTYIAERPEIKKVYLINQDYAFGHSVEKSAEELLKKKRPDIEIVGKDRHPLAQVRDFAPYVAKIKAAGADTVISGNWGADLVLLIKAAKDAGLDAKFYTYYAYSTGLPTAIGEAGIDQVRYVGYWNPNDSVMEAGKFITDFHERFDDDYFQISTYTSIRMLSEAIRKSGSTDPVKVAFAMEGMEVESLNGKVEMRADDHQLQQMIYIASFQKVDGDKVKYDQEDTGIGWRTEAKLDAEAAERPTTCKMKRPKREE